MFESPNYWFFFNLKSVFANIATLQIIRTCFFIVRTVTYKNYEKPRFIL